HELVPSGKCCRGLEIDIWEPAEPAAADNLSACFHHSLRSVCPCNPLTATWSAQFSVSPPGQCAAKAFVEAVLAPQWETWFAMSSVVARRNPGTPDRSGDEW